MAAGPVDYLIAGTVFPTRLKSPEIPLLGLDGRAALLRRLGSALAKQRDPFGDTAWPGALFDTLTVAGTRRAISASTLLEALLDGVQQFVPLLPPGNGNRPWLLNVGSVVAK